MKIKDRSFLFIENYSIDVLIEKKNNRKLNFKSGESSDIKTHTCNGQIERFLMFLQIKNG